MNHLEEAALRVDVSPCGTPSHVLAGSWADPPEVATACAAIVAPPHPFYGGRIDNPVVVALAEACAAARLGTLRFDWRGIGGSTGQPTGDPCAAVEDYSAVVAAAETRVAGELVACGYSWGAMAASRAAALHPRVTRLVLVAPPALMLTSAALRGLARDLLIVTGEHDRIAPPRQLAGLLDGVPRAQLRVIEAADHSFGGALDHVRALALAWLDSRLQ